MRSTQPTRMTNLYAVLLPLSLLSCAPVPPAAGAERAGDAKGSQKNDDAERAIRAERDRLQGSWELVGMVKDGKETPEEELKDNPTTVRFHGEAVAFIQKDQNQPTAYDLDLSHTPKRMTIRVTKPAPVPEHKTLVAVYDLEGDTLRLALRTGEHFDRPPAEVKAGDGIALMTLRRKKDSRDAGHLPDSKGDHLEKKEAPDKAGGKPAATRPAAAVRVDLSSPRSAATTFVLGIYTGDADAVLASSLGTEEQRRVLVKAARGFAAIHRLRTAWRQRFHETPHMRGFPPDTDELAKSLAEVEVTEDGDGATVGTQFKVRREGGKWRVVPGALADTWGMDVPRLDGLAEAFGGIADDLEAGKYATKEEADKAIELKMQELEKRLSGSGK
jgi:uncharacterized protein (TIGR03067 family)